MATMEWTENLEVGLGPMDDTHREFVVCYNAMVNADDSAFLGQLDAFIQHTVRHFAQENVWMEKVNFPGCHRAEHDRVLAVIQDVRKRVANGDIALGRRLAEELPAWFETHATGMDAALAFHLQTLDFNFKTGEIGNPAALADVSCSTASHETA
ncbi:hemerythrin domain-containing protein [Denitromonas iodatirespirans]|uniref:Hemerythrin domain-containing protein n=1 Tax=Denitromonas iodatirespirans TaxID=2795389 RepID=A0A944D651_DENI1|nr:hemerythrin domain-containing protein [Denitromonas iodatirespirans]MBT0960629.1 hemerythrin domain-containing protein [Denitromonas iodatirespirans]